MSNIIRAVNRGLVLRLLRDEGPLPRAELARRTGLSATTMTKLVAELMDQGTLTDRTSGEQRVGEQRVGRPSTDVMLAQESGYVVGVQVGAGNVHIGLCDLLAQIVCSTSFDFDPATPADGVLDRLATEVGELISACGVDRRKVLGIGVAAPGPVDLARRVNLLSINLGWQNVPFSDRLEAVTGLNTLVDHNVRAMAVAECRFGVGDQGTMLYVYVRTGVGAGLMMGGEPFRSGSYGVTELGHLRVVEKGRQCACGATGCLETVVSEPYLTEQLAAAGFAPDISALAQADSIRDELVDHLTTGLASAVNLLNPQLILLGGIFEGASEALLDQVRGALHTKAFPVLRDDVRVSTPTLGPNPGVIGGAAIALDHFFYKTA